jgi:hypothetical protein
MAQCLHLTLHRGYNLLVLSTGSKTCRISTGDLLLRFSKRLQHARVKTADGAFFDDDFVAQLSSGAFQICSACAGGGDVLVELRNFRA